MSPKSLQGNGKTLFHAIRRSMWDQKLQICRNYIKNINDYNISIKICIDWNYMYFISEVYKTVNEKFQLSLKLEKEKIFCEFKLWDWRWACIQEHMVMKISDFHIGSC